VKGKNYSTEEGFSSTEKDIRASYGTQGLLKRNTDGQICKLGDNNRVDTEIILEKESLPMDPMASIDPTYPTDPIDPTNPIDPTYPTNPMDMFNDRMDKESNKRDSENDRFLQITDRMRQLEVDELKEIQAITQKLDILQVNLEHSEEKEKLMNKLIDKIYTGPLDTGSPRKSNTHILLFIVLFVIIAVGGVAIYYVVGPSISGGPITYREAVNQAKQNIMKRKGMTQSL